MKQQGDLKVKRENLQMGGIRTVEKGMKGKINPGYTSVTQIIFGANTEYNSPAME